MSNTIFNKLEIPRKISGTTELPSERKTAEIQLYNIVPTEPAQMIRKYKTAASSTSAGVCSTISNGLVISSPITVTSIVIPSAINIDEKNELIDIAKQYCESKNIPNDEQLEIALLDNEEAENFLEKVFNNMKVIRGLITKKD